MRCREQHTWWTAVAMSQQCGTFATRGIEDSGHVINPFLESRDSWQTVRQPNTAVIEDDQP
jgi:hypothetical protein